MVDREVSQDISEMLAQLAEIAADESWYWRAKVAQMLREGLVKYKNWAPKNKQDWEHYAKVVDEQGETAGFVDMTDGQKIELNRDGVKREGQPDSAIRDEHVIGLDAVLESSAVVAARQESFAEREARLGGDSVAWAAELAWFLDDPRFARLVEQEHLVMDAEGRWVVGEDAEVLADSAGQRLKRAQVIERAEDAGWEWDGVAGARPALDSRLRDEEFDVERDSLVRVGQSAWAVVHESDSPLELDEAEFVSDGEAREIAVEQLGWDWVDSPEVEVDGSRPVVVVGAQVEVPEGTQAVLADEWAWADGAAEESRVEGAWSAFGETELTRGSDVPVGTVGESGVDAGELDRQYQHFFDESADVGAQPDRY